MYDQDTDSALNFLVFALLAAKALIVSALFVFQTGVL